MLLLIKYTLLYGIVLMLVALGGMFSEHSGIINIALEGIMVIGGVAGVLTLTMLPAELSPFLTVLISVLVAALAGVVYSLLLAFASINLKADQTIGGTALNLLATAIAVVIAKSFARIFYRNSINIGLPIMECPEAVDAIEAGDTVQVDFNTGVITDETNGKVFHAEPFPPFIQKIIADGGLMKSLTK